MCFIQMFARSNNIRASSQRYGGNWRTEGAKTAAGLGALGLGGYLGYKAAGGSKNLYDIGKGAVSYFYPQAVATKAAVEASTPFYTAISGGFPDLVMEVL
jgi:hypothetical protein